MKRLAELRAKLEGLKADASAILDRMDAGTATPDDDTALAALTADIETAKADIAAAEKLADMRRDLGATAARPALSLGTRNEPNPETTGGFKSLAEMAVKVREAATGAGIDRRLMGAPTNVVQGTGGDGEGFLLPTEFRDQIWNAVAEQDTLLSRFTIEQTSRRSIQFLADETTPWGAAGVQANWRAEGSVMTPTKLATKALRMELHDLFVFAGVTEEMLEDAPRLNQQLTTKAAMAIAWKASEAVVWGDGVGKPLGFMNSGALVTVAAENAQTADTIVPANVNKMYSRLMMAPGQPFWLANRDIFPQLQAMGFGADTPLFYPPGGITTAPNGTLLGYPVVYSEHAATLGDLGDLMLVQPAGYMAAQRAGGPQFATSIHLWFDYATQAFRWTFRMAGQPLLSAPVSPARGSATKSHFVALAAR